MDCNKTMLTEIQEKNIEILDNVEEVLKIENERLTLEFEALYDKLEMVRDLLKSAKLKKWGGKELHKEFWDNFHDYLGDKTIKKIAKGLKKGEFAFVDIICKGDKDYKGLYSVYRRSDAAYIDNPYIAHALYRMVKEGNGSYILNHKEHNSSFVIVLTDDDRMRLKVTKEGVKKPKIEVENKFKPMRCRIEFRMTDPKEHIFRERLLNILNTLHKEVEILYDGEVNDVKKPKECITIETINDSSVRNLRKFPDIEFTHTKGEVYLSPYIHYTFWTELDIMGSYDNKVNKNNIFYEEEIVNKFAQFNYWRNQKVLGEKKVKK